VSIIEGVNNANHGGPRNSVLAMLLELLDDVESAMKAMATRGNTHEGRRTATKSAYAPRPFSRSSSFRVVSSGSLVFLELRLDVAVSLLRYRPSSRARSVRREHRWETKVMFFREGVFLGSSGKTSFPASCRRRAIADQT
jgi:hypothetical protein